jgi:hypothetical protein
MLTSPPFPKAAAVHFPATVHPKNRRRRWLGRHLACVFYRLIKHGQQYVGKSTEHYEAKYHEQQIRSLAKRAQKLGLQLVIPKTA